MYTESSQACDIFDSIKTDNHEWKHLPFEIESYFSQTSIHWPASGNHILASYDHEGIIVYQAYNDQIAEALVASQSLHDQSCLSAGFCQGRMTWIKPNFLWMMFRSGWATKPNQEHILAIKLTHEGFRKILTNAVKSTGSNQTRQDSVRLQWDPDHLPDGSKSTRRAIQLGIRGILVEEISREFIVSITDVTDFVVKMRDFIDSPEDLLTPVERVYKLDPDEDAALIERIGLDCSADRSVAASCSVPQLF